MKKYFSKKKILISVIILVLILTGIITYHNYQVSIFADSHTTTNAEEESAKYEVFNGIDLSEINSKINFEFNDKVIPVFVENANIKDHKTNLVLKFFDSKDMSETHVFPLSSKFFQLVQSIERNGQGYMITLNTHGSGKMFTYYYDKNGFREVPRDDNLGFKSYSRLIGNYIYDFYYLPDNTSTIIQYYVNTDNIVEKHRQNFPFESGGMYSSGDVIILDLFNGDNHTIFSWEKDFSTKIIDKNRNIEVVWDNDIVFNDSPGTNFKKLTLKNIYSGEETKLGEFNSNYYGIRIIKNTLMFGSGGRAGTTMIFKDNLKKILDTPEGFGFSFTMQIFDFSEYLILYTGDTFLKYDPSNWTEVRKYVGYPVPKNLDKYDYPLPIIIQYTRD